MPPRIDPNEAAQAWLLLDTLLRSPETRTDALKLVKKWNPKASIPELDAAAPVEGKMAELEKRLTDALAKLDNDKTDSVLLSKLDGLRTKRGYTDEGMEKIKKIMTDHLIGDPEIAANHFDATQPKGDPAAPSGYFPSSFIDETDKGVEPWFQNEDAAADAEIMQIMREMNGGRVH